MVGHLKKVILKRIQSATSKFHSKEVIVVRIHAVGP